MAYDGLPFLVVSAHGDAPPLVRQMRKAARRPVDLAASRALAEKAWRSRPDWAGVLADVSLGDGVDGLDFVEAVRHEAPNTSALVVAGAIETHSVNRIAQLGVTLARRPIPFGLVVTFMRRALEHRELTLTGRLDPRVEIALDVEILASSTPIETLRAPELLRLVVAGHSREEVEAKMKIGSNCYAYHVGQLLRGTGASDLQALVIRIMRRALQMKPSPVLDVPDHAAGELAHVTEIHELSGVRDRRTGRLVEGGNLKRSRRAGG